MMDPRRQELMASVRRVVIKVGSSLLTAGAGGIRRSMIERLARQVVRLRQAGRECILVTSVAIGAGLEPLDYETRPRTLPRLQACAAVGQTKLMEAYDRAFRRHGVAVAQVLLTRDGLHDRARYLNARNTLHALIERGAVPIINENDTVSVDEIRFGDNDILSALVTDLAEAELLVILTDVPGFMTADPRDAPDAELVATVEEVTDEHAAAATVGGTFLGTGGMASKLEAARTVNRSGEICVIAGGDERNVLGRILGGRKVGTLFAPREVKLASRKRWIAFGRAARGAMVVDDGARTALTERGKSLLATGVVSIEGSFEAGDSVAVRSESGEEIARGLANYSSCDLQKILGRRTSEIEAILGRKDFDEVIHRDNLVVL
jgi:glutamate 5-kinase